MEFDFTSGVIAGVGAPMFRYWYNGSVQENVTLEVPQGAPLIKFIPDQLVYKDPNNNEQVIHFGFDVELTINYEKLTPQQIKPIIKVYSWRSYEAGGSKVQCIPHTDFPNFNFFGRFVDSFDFRYIDGKFLGHSLTLTFKSTQKIQDIPRMTANVILSQRIR